MDAFDAVFGVSEIGSPTTRESIVKLKAKGKPKFDLA